MCLPEFCAYATATPPPLHRLPDPLTQWQCGSAMQAFVVDSPALSSPRRGSGSHSAATKSRNFLELARQLPNTLLSEARVRIRKRNPQFGQDF